MPSDPSRLLVHQRASSFCQENKWRRSVSSGARRGCAVERHHGQNSFSVRQPLCAVATGEGPGHRERSPPAQSSQLLQLCPSGVGGLWVGGSPELFVSMHGLVHSRTGDSNCSLFPLRVVIHLWTENAAPVPRRTPPPRIFNAMPACPTWSLLLQFLGEKRQGGSLCWETRGSAGSRGV